MQLTKDLVPVIYHDWTVTETGFDIPLNAITAEQFLNLRPSGHIKEYHTGVSNDGQGELLPTVNTYSAADTLEEPITSATPVAKQRVNRSHSLGSIKGVPTLSRTDDSNRLALTRTNKLGKVKGNGPETIQAPFTTLAETLKVTITHILRICTTGVFFLTLQYFFIIIISEGTRNSRMQHRSQVSHGRRGGR